jgi:hypothetical protein
MALTLAHILNEPISYASVTHADFKSVFDKFKKILQKFANTGIIEVENKSNDPAKIILSFVGREYEIRFTTGFINNVFHGRIAAWRKLEAFSSESATEIGFVTFHSRKGRITDPLTKAEGSLLEPHFCRILIYAWLLKDLGWDMAQLNMGRAPLEIEHKSQSLGES